MDLKMWRATRGLTQREAAHWVGVTPGTWSKWERGIARRPVMLRRMLRAIDMIERAERERPRVVASGPFYVGRGWRPWLYELTEWSEAGAA